jgi:hypothetical protein
MAEEVKETNPDTLLESLEGGKFKCFACDKVYSSKYSARRHVRAIHQEQKDISCPDLSCTRKFTNYNTAKRHAVQAHGSKEVSCPDPVCIFKTVDILRSV